MWESRIHREGLYFSMKNASLVKKIVKLKTGKNAFNIDNTNDIPDIKMRKMFK